MSILPNNKISQVTPPTPDSAVVAKRVAERIKQVTVQNFNQFIQVQRQGIRLLWENPDASPQEIINALGEDAIKIFQFHGALTQFVTGLAALDGADVDVKLPPNAFTINLSAGSITVEDGPYIP